MDRVLSRHGNVIAADFRPRTSIDITLRHETLYLDDRVVVTRVTAALGGRPVAVLHFLGDIATGRVASL